jgi:hypothetical protein
MKMLTLLLVLYLALAMGVSYVAAERGRSTVGFFFAALFFSPLIALLILIALPIRPVTAPIATAASQYWDSVANYKVANDKI